MLISRGVAITLWISVEVPPKFINPELRNNSMNYDLELERAASYIKEKKAKTVCIQLPDGLKQHSKDIADYLEKETSAEILIWLGECFGACDIPIGLDKMKIDIMIQWGHNIFHKKEWAQ